RQPHVLARPDVVLQRGVCRRGKYGHDLLAEPLAAGDGALMALERVTILRLTPDAELARQHLRGLSHVEPADQIGEPFGERDARAQHAGPEAAEHPEL